MSERGPRLMEAVAAWSILPDGVLSEARALPAPGVLHAWRVLRLLAVRAASSRPASPVTFGRRGMAALEESILFADYDDAIRYPLAVLARQLTPGVEPDVERLGWACLCAAEWAISHGAPGMARSFIYAAARITGLSSYMAVARAAAAGERQSQQSADLHDGERSGSGASGGNP